MVKTQCARTKRAGTTRDRFTVPYFSFDVNTGYEGIAALVTEDKGELEKGIEAFRIGDKKVSDICHLLYRENDGVYIALVGVKAGGKSVAKRRIGGFRRSNPHYNRDEDIPGIIAQHLTVNGIDIKHHSGKNLLTEIVRTIKCSPNEYLMKH